MSEKARWEHLPYTKGPDVRTDGPPCNGCGWYAGGPHALSLGLDTGSLETLSPDHRPYCSHIRSPEDNFVRLGQLPMWCPMFPGTIGYRAHHMPETFKEQPR